MARETKTAMSEVRRYLGSWLNFEPQCMPEPLDDGSWNIHLCIRPLEEQQQLPNHLPKPAWSGAAYAHHHLLRSKSSVSHLSTHPPVHPHYNRSTNTYPKHGSGNTQPSSGGAHPLNRSTTETINNECHDNLVQDSCRKFSASLLVQGAALC